MPEEAATATDEQHEHCRDMRRHRNSRFGEQQVRSAVLTEAMAFLDPWILRNNLNSAIKRHQARFTSTPEPRTEHGSSPCPPTCFHTVPRRM
jgi:hypothetical protein